MAVHEQDSCRAGRKAGADLAGNKSFLAAYCAHIWSMSIHRWMRDWIRDFLNEVIKSPLNQLSLVLGVMGIAGLLAAGFRFILGHWVTAVVSILAGVMVVFGITMFWFATKWRSVLANPPQKELNALLKLLMDSGPLSRSAICGSLGITPDGLAEVMRAAQNQGWFQMESGAFKVAESMKPIARMRLLKQAT